MTFQKGLYTLRKRPYCLQQRPFILRRDRIHQGLDRILSIKWVYFPELYTCKDRTEVILVLIFCDELVQPFIGSKLVHYFASLNESNEKSYFIPVTPYKVHSHSFEIGKNQNFIVIWWKKIHLVKHSRSDSKFTKCWYNLRFLTKPEI